MADLPSGTVTLLFSDMEGSTRLLARLGDEYATTLSLQRKILRSAWSDWDGVELGTEGDSFFVVFESAMAAVSAAVQAQRELALSDVAEADRPRVRIGIHTGTPRVHEGGYVGLDVHRAARISAAAHGGQVLLSEATAALVREENAGIALIDLGSHHLKDISRAEHLFQVAASGLDESFAPLRSLGTVTGLPVAMTPLVGRSGELRELAALVRSDTVRLVTLTGPGGGGKSRLACALAEQVADDFSDGLYFVALATVTTADGMWSSLATALNLPPEGQAPPGFFDHVGHRHALVVLDNLEQIEAADTVVNELLLHAPQLVVVATSRNPLHLRGEHEHPVPVLGLPDGENLAEVERSGAVQMFIQQASMVRPSFGLTRENAGDVAEICRRLDGLPLAIELAAARVKLLSPQALVSRMDSSLDLALRGVDRPTRQQTLRETIAWSYDLLSPVQQRFLNYLGVFVGGAELDAVIAVVPAEEIDGADHFDVVSELADASLLSVVEAADGEPRIALLETIGAYALERLDESGRLGVARARHAAYFADTAKRFTRQGSDRGHRVDQASISQVMSQWWFEANLDNIRAVLAWALPLDEARPVDEGRTELGFELWSVAGYVLLGVQPKEGELWARRVMRCVPGHESLVVVRCYEAASQAARYVGDWEACLDRARKGLAMSQRLGNEAEVCKAQHRLVVALLNIGADDEALEVAEAALSTARRLKDSTATMESLANLAVVNGDQGDWEKSLEHELEALDLAVSSNNNYWITIERQNIGCTLRQLGRADEALRHFVAVAPDVAASREADALTSFGEDFACVLSDLGEVESAARLFGAVDALRAASGNVRGLVQEEEIHDALERAKSALADEWQQHYSAGADETVEAILNDLTARAT